MSRPSQLLLEGLDRLGKDTLIRGILDRCGYHLVLHFKKPELLSCYKTKFGSKAARQYQEDSFRTMFQLLRGAPHAAVICNRAHLGECVYSPLYRGYDGSYVFELEREFSADTLPSTRLVLLTEDFSVSTHFKDDGKSLGGAEDRCREQDLFLQAFETSLFKDKRAICVTDAKTGEYKAPDAILDEALA